MNQTVTVVPYDISYCICIHIGRSGTYISGCIVLVEINGYKLAYLNTPYWTSYPVDFVLTMFTLEGAYLKYRVVMKKNIALSVGLSVGASWSIRLFTSKYERFAHMPSNSVAGHVKSKFCS